MSSAATLDLATAVEALSELSERALQDQCVEDFELVERRLNELDATVRELHQSLWASEIKAAIRHLESGQPLTPEDHEVIRTFLVSDAEHYLAQENNFADWVHELRRLLGEITSRLRTVDRNSAGELRGVLKDAVRLAPDIRNYLDDRRRLELFNAGLKEPDSSTCATLARLLRDQLVNPNL